MHFYIWCSVHCIPVDAMTYDSFMVSKTDTKNKTMGASVTLLQQNTAAETSSQTLHMSAKDELWLFIYRLHWSVSSQRGCGH